MRSKPTARSSSSSYSSSPLTGQGVFAYLFAYVFVSWIYPPQLSGARKSACRRGGDSGPQEYTLIHWTFQLKPLGRSTREPAPLVRKEAHIHGRMIMTSAGRWLTWAVPACVTRPRHHVLFSMFPLSLSPRRGAIVHCYGKCCLASSCRADGLRLCMQSRYALFVPDPRLGSPV